MIIYPTDTIYGLGCDIFQHKAIERICQIKQINPEKAQLSFVCYDLSDLSNYTKSISTPLYRVLKNHLPGPYTFILPASKEVPKILKSKKNTDWASGAGQCDCPDHRERTGSSGTQYFAARRKCGRIYRPGNYLRTF